MLRICENYRADFGPKKLTTGPVYTLTLQYYRFALTVADH